jgi:hypothetical protein
MVVQSLQELQVQALDDQLADLFVVTKAVRNTTTLDSIGLGRRRGVIFGLFLYGDHPGANNASITTLRPSRSSRSHT